MYNLVSSIIINKFMLLKIRFFLKYFFILLALLYFTCSAKEIDFEKDFLQSLDDVSEIATKTKLNIDDTPSFITVLRSKKLKRLGVRNVFEALALVPGVELQKERSGVPLIVFRGVTQKGEVKLMVDGITINNSYRGSIYYFLDFPIELIQRIEVIRGSGSVLYGSNAISGVINIITNSSQEFTKNSLFSTMGTYKNNKIGGILSTNIKDIKIALDAYMQKDQKTIKVKQNPTNQAGDSDRHLKDYSVGININSEHFSIMGRVKKSDTGNAYGIFNVLDKSTNSYQNENRTIISKLSYKNSINSKNNIKLSIGYTNYQQKVEVAHPSSAIINSDYEENNFFGELDLLSKSIKNNRLLIGLRVESFDELKNSWHVNNANSQNPIVDSGFYREVGSVYLNDEYMLNQKTDISAGFRYDHYSDFQGSFSPNLGIVYKLNNELRLKALYSHSFRAPSWVELTSNDELKAEKSDTIETGIIFKHQQNNIFRANFYISQIDDMITKDSISRKYIQKTKNSFYGMEMEYIYNPNHNTEINLVASYVNAKDNDGEDIPNIANILAFASLDYSFESGFTFGSLLKYISSSKRYENDSRDDAPQSFIFDQTISYNYKNFTASLVFKDLFDANKYYALGPNPYLKDFDDGGRSAMLNISLEF